MFEFISSLFIGYTLEEQFTLRFIFSWVAPILVIIGWVILRRNAHSFAKRSEMNNAGKEISSLLDRIIDVAEEYWLSHNSKCKYSAAVYESLIINFLSRVFEKEEVLRKYGVIIDVKTIVKFRRSLTLYEKSYPNLNQANFLSALKISTNLHISIESKINDANLENNITNLINYHPSKMGILLVGLILILYFKIFEFIFTMVF